ncbi:MAG: HAMP domain-containing histidine kinase [Chloroflexi bacterium]|nr:HAMP domain-containing histidine kinase [Chloroflexota bacterium]
MRSSLWLKLTFAFAGTAMFGVLLAAILIGRATSIEFGRYLEHGNSMGHMMASGMAAMMGVPEQAFLHAVRNALWVAGISAVAASAIMAIILSRQITAPLRRLSTAARHVAHGDLSVRVAHPGTNDKYKHGADEVGVLTNTFNSMVETLDRGQEMRRNLMADLAHEMSTPLAIMQSNLEGMLDGVVETSSANIASLQEEALLLSRLVKDLRTLSQVESGRLELHPEETDVGTVVSAVVKAAEPEARRKHINLSIEAAPNTPPALIDTDRITQVVGNLLSNALRYTSEDGWVKVGVGPYGQEGTAGKAVTISVADNGQGIGGKDLPHIFDRYYRGSQPRDRRGGGSGIGLAVVKELVEAHKGTVWAESTPGNGSTFFVTLPAVGG